MGLASLFSTDWTFKYNLEDPPVKHYNNLFIRKPLSEPSSGDNVLV